MTRSFAIHLSELVEENTWGVSGKMDFELLGVSTVGSPQDNTLLFTKSWTDEIQGRLARVWNCLVLAPAEVGPLETALDEQHEILWTPNPRLTYAEILTHILRQGHQKRSYTRDEELRVIGENVSIAKGTVLGPFVFVDHDVTIGRDCVIKSGARIGPNVAIGSHSVIGENSVIGAEGFGVERRGDFETLKIPHIGGVRLGESVKIGALNTVVAGTIVPTIIEDHVSTDDHVHIAHNCRIGRGTLITACAEISGSVIVGEKGWIGPNTSIMNGISIGKNCVIGLGAVVTKSFPDDQTLLGNPARTLEQLRAKGNADGLTTDDENSPLTNVGGTRRAQERELE